MTQSITEEPIYQAKALTVVMDTIKTAGAAVVVTIPSIINYFTQYPKENKVDPLVNLTALWPSERAELESRSFLC